ncbi:sensor histidine kinase [Murimonas intestini]|mgnify:CR=1 FL=1|uniref:sensor histidine kinase n=1 Tax=Murimonas intestini TaxID=1337051 RepID=UPI0011DCAF67|nr:histidine kinase [Murimonas intestini]
MVQKIRWNNSVKTKQFLLLLVFILVNVIFSIGVYEGAFSSARDAIYEKMSAQAQFYLSSIDTQISNTRKMQTDFFTDRKLAFLVYPNTNMSDYERREALLTEEERLLSIKNSNLFIEQADMYLPYSGYKITLNGVKNIKEEDYIVIEEYSRYTQKSIYYKEGELFMVSLGNNNYVADEMPEQLFFISLSIDKIRESLAGFNSIEGSGSFLYNEENDMLIESAGGEFLGEEIVSQVDLSGNMDHKMQIVKIENKRYLTSVSNSEYLGEFVQYYPDDAVLSQLNVYKIYLSVYIAGTLAIAVLFSFYTEKFVHSPLKKLLRAFGNVKAGNFDEQIGHRREDEFSYIYDGFNQMTKRIKTLIEEVYIYKNLKQRAELKQLQAQINPHFLYNSFFALSRRVKRGDLENAEEFANYLGTYFKFLTRNESDEVALEKEVEHARSYTNIQAVRFADRIKVEFAQLPEEYSGFLVPRLILQPIIENAFQHGLENKEGEGILRIFFSEDGLYLYIHVEDNGEEADEEYIKKMQEIIENTDEREVTGILNIHKRLRIYYEMEGGLKIGRSELGGVHIQIVIPKNKGGENH